MSIANVFAFLFETKGSQKVVSELKSIKGNVDNLGKSESNLTEQNTKLMKSVAGLISTYVGFKKILSEVMSFAKGGEDLMLLAQSAGISAETLERYGHALENYGGGMSSALSTISHLNQQMQDLRFGGGGAIRDVAIRYGISLQGKKGLATGEEMLFNIAKRMESLGTQAQLDLGKKLGLDASTISLLQTGVAGLNEELEKASKFTLYSPEDIENSRKFQLALRELRNSFEKVWAVLSRALMPILTTIMKAGAKVFNYLADHKAVVLGFFAGVATLLGIVAIKALIAWGAILAPILPIIAGITLIGTAIGLLIDDFLAFKDGGDSCIGWIAERFADFFLFLFEWGDKISNFFSGIWDSIIKGITGAFDWVIEKWNKLKSFIPFFGKDEKITVEDGRKAITSTETPLSTMTTKSIVNSGDNNVKIDTVNVNTQATDAQGISKGIGGALSYELQNVLMQNTGGAVA